MLRAQALEIFRAAAHEGARIGRTVGLLPLAQDPLGEHLLECLLEQRLLFVDVPESEIGGAGDAHDFRIQERAAALHAVGHAHAVTLCGQQVTAQQSLAFEPLRALQAGQRFDLPRRGFQMHPQWTQRIARVSQQPARQIGVVESNFVREERRHLLARKSLEERRDSRGVVAAESAEVGVHPAQAHVVSRGIGLLPGLPQCRLLENVIAQKGLVRALTAEHDLQPALAHDL